MSGKADVFALLASVVLAFYGILALNIGVDHLGQLDNITYVLLFMFVYFLLSSIGNRRIRIISLIVFIGVNIFLVWGNLMYYRFFNAFATMDVLGETQSAHFAVAAAPLLTNWRDMIFLAIIPGAIMMLVTFKAPRKNNIPSALKLLPLIVLSLTVHWFMVDNFSFAINQVNPVIHMPRQMIQSSIRTRLINNVSVSSSGALLPSGVLYESCEDGEYPFLRRPVQGIVPPYDLKGQKPNLVLLIVESLQASEMGAYNGGRQSYTPNLDRLIEDSLMFRNYYSSGVTSIDSEASILTSHYPKKPKHGMPGVRLQGFPSILKDSGYSTAFISGVKETKEIAYRKSFGIDDFYVTVPAQYSKVGMVGYAPSDEDLLGYSLDVLEGLKEPFFAEIFTMSSHTAFFKSLPSHVKSPPAYGDKRYKEYAEGYYYADYALGEFFQEVRKRDYFDNTIFVITADHGASIAAGALKADQIMMNEWVRRLPLFVYAPSIIKPLVVEELGAQVDLGPTLLDILGIYKVNSMIGTSLLRQHENQQTVHMPFITSDRPSIRVGNDYCYSPGFAVDYELPGQLKRIGQHVCFNSDVDLLSLDNMDSLVPLSPERSQELMRTMFNISDISMHLLYSDKIWPVDDALVRCGVSEAKN